MFKIIRRILCGVLALVIIVGVAFVVLVNMTPRKLGFASLNIQGVTIEDLGLADEKIWDIAMGFKGFANPKEDEIITNPYNEVEDKKDADKALEGSKVSSDYSAIAAGKVTYKKRYLKNYKDTTLAYIFNQIVKSTTDTNESVQFVKELGLNLAEVTINKTSAEMTLNTVSKANVEKYKTQIEDTLGAAKSFITIPKEAYFASEFTFTVDTETGKMITTSKNMVLNGDNDSVISKAIFTILMNALGKDYTIESFNEEFGKGFSTIIYNLGGIGTGEVNDAGEITGDYSYSDQGVSSHQLSLVTHI